MPSTLDCSSGEATKTSLASLFNCSEERLSSTLLMLDIESTYEEHFDDIDVPASQYLYNYVVEALGFHEQLAEVIWFHGTRTLRPSNLEEGILPLNQSKELVWETLITSAPNDTVKGNLRSLKNNGVGNFQYNLRTSNHNHWGPYGVLVRDVAINAESVRHHNYLGMPELIEDIINEYRQEYNFCLTEHYTDTLTPTLIKFKASSNLSLGCIEAALGYLYTYVRGEPVNGLATMCIDKGGSPILPDDILEIEYL